MSVKHASQLPDTVYHYTNVQTLHTILSNPEPVMRGTHLAYLNDSEEYRFAARLLKEALARIDPDKSHHHHALAHLQDSDRFFAYLAVQQGYVTCFSDKGDALSQWRAYGARSSESIGCAIAFDTSVLLHHTGGFVQPTLQRVLYQSLESGADYLLENLPPLNKTGVCTKPTQVLDMNFSMLAPYLKHESFVDEGEVRVWVPRGSGEVSYRPSRYGVTPYVEWPLPLGALTKVVLGPSPHLELARKSIEEWLRSRCLEVPVEVTNSPYRDW